MYLPIVGVVFMGDMNFIGGMDRVFLNGNVMWFAQVHGGVLANWYRPLFYVLGAVALDLFVKNGCPWGVI